MEGSRLHGAWSTHVSTHNAPASLHVVVPLTQGFVVLIDLLLHEVAFPGPVAVQAVALAVFKMGFGRELVVVPLQG
jgi:hypothetical protein